MNQTERLTYLRAQVVAAAPTTEAEFESAARRAVIRVSLRPGAHLTRDEAQEIADMLATLRPKPDPVETAIRRTAEIAAQTGVRLPTKETP